ncbi:MAG: Carbon monoxide dehydrogenase medium chain [Actinobacteria bacterium ADurb.Bin444]|nr:MAG: Carbon monoxide dehydrogenase medium chain [Actinobacteria bacterium ADurb.Bin444]
MLCRQYCVATSLDEVAASLSAGGDGAKIIGGGTDLVIRLSDTCREEGPELLVDVSGIPELRGIELVDGQVSIGAATTMSEIAHSDLVARFAPCLAQAAEAVATLQIRNVATIGGNLANASPAADTVPALMAAQAEVDIVGPEGPRAITVASLATGPGKTSLTPLEIITRVRVPAMADGEGQAFVKLGRRKALSISIVNAAACVGRAGTSVTHARLALGAVAPVVMLSLKVGGLLEGVVPDAEVWAAVEKCIAQEVQPIDDIRGGAAYRRSMAGVFGRRALQTAYEAAGMNSAPEGR